MIYSRFLGQLNTYRTHQINKFRVYHCHLIAKVKTIYFKRLYTITCCSFCSIQFNCSYLHCNAACCFFLLFKLPFSKYILILLLNLRIIINICSMGVNHLLDSLVIECWHRVREDPGSIPSQGPRHTKDVIKMVPEVPLFSTEH